MAEAKQILDALAQRGLKAELRAGVLLVGPRDLINDELRATIKDNMPDLLAALACADADVEWRVAAMLGQLLPLAWPCAVPSVLAEPTAKPNPEDCRSCGELLDVGEGDSQTCGACARAKSIALELWLRRPAQNVRAA